MKPIDHLEESKCLSNNQNLKMKVAFLSLSENKISAEEANYLGKLPLIQPNFDITDTQNDHFARVQGQSSSGRWFSSPLPRAWRTFYVGLCWPLVIAGWENLTLCWLNLTKFFSHVHFRCIDVYWVDVSEVWIYERKMVKSKIHAFIYKIKNNIR